MKEILVEWTYWRPILVSVGILMLYHILSEGRWACAALLAGETIALSGFLMSPKGETTVLLSIVLSCALAGLISGWKKSSLVGRVARIVLVLIPLVICGRAGELFVFMLFQFLLSVIYVLPSRKYRQEGKLKCFALWIAQFIVVMLITLPMVNFRISLLWNSEASFGIAILLMPVIAMLPVALFDLLLPDNGTQR